MSSPSRQKRSRGGNGEPGGEDWKEEEEATRDLLFQSGLGLGGSRSTPMDTGVNWDAEDWDGDEWADDFEPPSIASSSFSSFSSSSASASLPSSSSSSSSSKPVSQLVMVMGGGRRGDININSNDIDSNGNVCTTAAVERRNHLQQQQQSITREEKTNKRDSSRISKSDIAKSLSSLKSSILGGALHLQKLSAMCNNQLLIGIVISLIIPEKALWSTNAYTPVSRVNQLFSWFKSKFLIDDERFSHWDQGISGFLSEESIMATFSPSSSANSSSSSSSSNSSNSDHSRKRSHDQSSNSSKSKQKKNIADEPLDLSSNQAIQVFVVILRLFGIKCRIVGAIRSEFSVNLDMESDISSKSTSTAASDSRKSNSNSNSNSNGFTISTSGDVGVKSQFNYLKSSVWIEILATFQSASYFSRNINIYSSSKNYSNSDANSNSNSNSNNSSNSNSNSNSNSIIANLGNKRSFSATSSNNKSISISKSSRSSSSNSYSSNSGYYGSKKSINNSAVIDLISDTDDDDDAADVNDVDSDSDDFEDEEDSLHTNLAKKTSSKMFPKPKAADPYSSLKSGGGSSDPRQSDNLSKRPSNANSIITEKSYSSVRGANKAFVPVASSDLKFEFEVDDEVLDDTLDSAWLVIDLARCKTDCKPDLAQSLIRDSAASKSEFRFLTIIAAEEDNYMIEITKTYYSNSYLYYNNNFYCKVDNLLRAKMKVEAWLEKLLRTIRGLYGLLYHIANKTASGSFYLSSSDNTATRNRRIRESEAESRREYHLNLSDPKTVMDYKNHSKYVLPRYLLHNEVIHPTKVSKPARIVKGEMVYLREHVEVCYTKLQWQKKLRQVIVSEAPLKRYSRKNSKGEIFYVELFGRWQTCELVRPGPIPEDSSGKLPVNEHGTMDVWDGCEAFIPSNTSLITLPWASKAAKALDINFAPAVFGFDRSNAYHTTAKIGGIVVMSKHKGLIEERCREISEERERMLQNKKQLRTVGNWEKLVRAALSRSYVKDTYGY